MDDERASSATLDLVTPVKLLLRGSKWLVLAAAVGGVLAYLASYAVAPTYAVRVLAVPVDSSTTLPMGSLADIPFVANYLGTIGGGSDAAQNVTFVNSSSFLMHVIEKFDLAPKLFPSRWDSSKNAWREDKAEPTEYELVERLRRRVSINLDRVNSVVVVEVSSGDPLEAYEIARGLIPEANSELSRQAHAHYSANVQYLRKLLDVEQVAELRATIAQLISQQMREMMLASNAASYAFRIIDGGILPREEDYVFPNRVALALVGAFGCLALASLIIVMSSRRS